MKKEIPLSLRTYFNQLDIAIQKLMSANAELQRLPSKDNLRTFEVWVTNADLVQLERVFASHSFDIAEKMASKKFYEACHEVDFMLIERDGQEPLQLFLSNRSINRRGESLQ